MVQYRIDSLVQTKHFDCGQGKAELFSSRIRGPRPADTAPAWWKASFIRRQARPPVEDKDFCSKPSLTALGLECSFSFFGRFDSSWLTMVPNWVSWAENLPFYQRAELLELDCASPLLPAAPWAIFSSFSLFFSQLFAIPLGHRPVRWKGPDSTSSQGSVAFLGDKL